MANNRTKQIERFGGQPDPFRVISDAVFERITDEKRPAPPTLKELAAEIEKENKFTGLSTDEKNFLWDCLTCVQGGEYLTEDDFFERATKKKVVERPRDTTLRELTELYPDYIFLYEYCVWYTSYDEDDNKELIQWYDLKKSFKATGRDLRESKYLDDCPWIGDIQEEIIINHDRQKIYTKERDSDAEDCVTAKEAEKLWKDIDYFVKCKYHFPWKE